MVDEGCGSPICDDLSGDYGIKVIAGVQVGNSNGARGSGLMIVPAQPTKPPSSRSDDKGPEISNPSQPIITSPEYNSNNPAYSIDDLVDYFKYWAYGIDLLKDMKLADQLIRKGFVIGKAFNPIPQVDFIAGLLEQGIADINNSDLTMRQRVQRAVLVGVESTITGVVSDGFGTLGFIGGEYIVPEGGGFVGYPILSIPSSIFLDGNVWENYNKKKFKEWDWGTYP